MLQLPCKGSQAPPCPGGVFKVCIVLGDDIPQLPDPGHVGVVLPAPPYHVRLLRCQLRQLRPDRGNVITDFASVDVKVDAPVIGGGHAFLRVK